MTDANLYLTTSDRAAIDRAALPLQPRDRQAFRRAVAEALQGREIGEGAVHRAIREHQRRFFDAPLSTDPSDDMRPNGRRR